MFAIWFEVRELSRDSAEELFIACFSEKESKLGFELVLHYSFMLLT